MKVKNIRPAHKRRFRRVKTTQSESTSPILANRIDLTKTPAIRPRQVWVADITGIRTREGWLYVAAILDAYSRKIVGWSSDSGSETSLVCTALEKALVRNPVRASDLIHHSDRGCQYASNQYQSMLKQRGITGSMSRKGNCYDNATMESFWATLKTELLQGREFASLDSARREIFRWIEVYYNRQRLHGALGFKSPVEFENSRN